jgi:16S rRNA (guanine(966)-N(2))-methyltransferase RsmD
LKEARPTTGKVLQALFNILGPVERQGFLDLFSGTGRIAKEALNRGASPVVAVEIVKARCREIDKLLSVGNEPNKVMLCMNVRRALRWLDKKRYSFHIVFADPPYDNGWGKDLPLLLSSYGCLIAPDGIIIIEHSADESVVTENTNLKKTDQRKYGNTVLDILVKDNPVKYGSESE